eukprot:14300967-Ditylum_brightwellii.AAC.1
MKCAILSANLGATCAFAPSLISSIKASSSLCVSETETPVSEAPVLIDEEQEVVTPAVPAVAPIHGWAPD